jgi:CDP-diacylglycerol--glycerol-3-phosphate 3-phosphatidyltransferase
MKLANFFTVLRIILAPVFLLIYFSPQLNSAFLHVSVCIMIPLLIFAEFTDFLDGFYARKANAVSDFGKLFDPFADVFLHITTFFCYAVSGHVSLVLILLIIYREFAMLFLRMIATKSGIAIGARKGGKFKTVLYVIAGFYSLFLESSLRLGFDFFTTTSVFTSVGTLLYLLALLAAYVSFIDYLIVFLPRLKNKNM